MAARETLMIVQESAFKTPVATPTVWTTATTYGLANAQAYYQRLDGGNAFTMRSRPAGIVRVPYGGGLAIDAYAVADKQECKGQLTVKLCVSHAPFLLSWAGVRIAGGTAPWTTSEPNGDLASCAIYHSIIVEGGGTKRRVYLGCKVDSWALAISEDSTFGTLTLQISGSTPQGNQFDSSIDPTAGVFPPAADNNYPIDPFVFIHAGGTNFIKLGGTVRTQFTELNVSVTNVLARRWYAQRYIALLRWLGRKTTVAARQLYQLSPDDRTLYEGLTTEAVQVELNNGTHGFIMDMKAQNIYDPYEDDLPLPDLYFESFTEGNMWDPTAGADFTLAFS